MSERRSRPQNKIQIILWTLTKLKWMRVEFKYTKQTCFKFPVNTQEISLSAFSNKKTKFPQFAYLSQLFILASFQWWLKPCDCTNWKESLCCWGAMHPQRTSLILFPTDINLKWTTFVALKTIEKQGCSRSCQRLCFIYIMSRIFWGAMLCFVMLIWLDICCVLENKVEET